MYHYDHGKDLLGHLRMVSGTRHSFHSVMLYDLQGIRAAQAIRQEAEKSLHGFSTGLGFIGDLNYVLMASFIAGAIEKSVSQKLHNEGVGLLEAYYNTCMAVRNSGKFLPLRFIQNIRVPVPSLWRCAQVTDEGQSAYMLNGDPCVVFWGRHITSIIWDKVEEYVVVDAKDAGQHHLASEPRS